MMHWLALAAAFALSQGDPADPAGAGDPPARGEAADIVDPGEITTIEMERERNRRLTVPVIIGGEGPFRFLVDTGAQATVLSSELADSLQLTDRSAATLVGTASSRPVETTFIPDFTLGERTFAVRTAPIVDAANIGDADGILGVDSLQDQRVLLDFEQGVMRVSDNFGSGGSNGYDIVVRARERLGQLIIHRAEIDGIRTAVIVDTGAQASIGNPALLRRMRSRTAIEDTLMTDVNGVQLVGPTRIARRLDIGRVQLANTPIAFADAPTFHALGLGDRPALILGMNELRLFSRVAIDFRSRRVLFDVPGTEGRVQNWNFNERATRLD
ncbi:retroviral-like aspartic protease family protein [Aurantiacibacter aquimixticola]|uniref:Peptidase A2 domain-containing protein n=1 Tax=Aurantiacibacter aquimixticola TaxID=1958945 RepID=A0A419RVU1_9SPHN|nr:retroviral-like aspartic protease family protein [Aurantiacibacter aquimixticola]RJY09898.1 hypothetical protein D6201_11530 [Aurantiacibacter aquimixticola]